MAIMTFQCAFKMKDNIIPKCIQVVDLSCLKFKAHAKGYILVLVKVHQHSYKDLINIYMKKNKMTIINNTSEEIELQDSSTVANTAVAGNDDSSNGSDNIQITTTIEKATSNNVATPNLLSVQNNYSQLSS